MKHASQKSTPSFKRIAIVANTTWNIYNFRLNLVRKLVQEGHEVIVMAPVDRYIFYTEELKQVEHVPIHRLKRKSLNPIHDILLFFELVRLYLKHKPDLILHYTVKPNIYGGLAARLLRIRSMAAITGVGYPLSHPGWLKLLVSWLYKMTLPYHHKVIFENIDDKHHFEKNRFTKPGQGVAVKGCGLDTEYFKPNGVHQPGEHIVFSFVGRLVYDKGIREFIEAGKRVKEKFPQTQFWMIGEIDEGDPSAVDHQELMGWIRDPDFHYFGAADKVKAFYDRSDCIVLPSYRGEGMPRVILEAMSMQKPVITTDAPGCREAVDHGVNGYIIPMQNISALAQAMKTFVQLDQETRKQMGNSGRNKAVAEFDERIIVEQLYAILVDS